jgi:DNA-binding IclR family transcriptional regulator
VSELEKTTGVPRNTADRALDDLRLLGLVTETRVGIAEKAARV